MSWGDARRQACELRRELEARPHIAGHDPEDTRKIRAYKGLIAELRAEVKRLVALVPREDTVPETDGEEAPAPEEELTPGPRPEEALAGKTVAVFGRLGEPVEQAAASPGTTAVRRTRSWRPWRRMQTSSWC